MDHRLARPLCIGVATLLGAVTHASGAVAAERAPSSKVDSRGALSAPPAATATTTAAESGEPSNASAPANGRKVAHEADGAEPASHADKSRFANASPFQDVFAPEWFGMAGPAVDIGGYFRVRGELFHNFALGRSDPASGALWPRPATSNYVDTLGAAHALSLCGGDASAPEVCDSDTQAGANMRLRLEPTLHISDNLKIVARIDMLDNVVLGSTPQGYVNQPSGDGGYAVVARGGYSPLGAFSSTAWAPSAGVNSTGDAVAVKRVWGEYASPLGKLSFGRMPHHWGLGMMFNGGGSYDGDASSTADRLMFSTGLEKYNLHVAIAWDFANEGATGSTLHAQQGDDALGAGAFEQGGRPYDLARTDDLDHWALMLVHQLDPQLARRQLARGKPVVTAGVYGAYRQQETANDSQDPDTGASIGQRPFNTTSAFVRRGYEAVITDLWLKLLYGKLRFEVEAALVYGSLDNSLRRDSDYDNLKNLTEDGWTMRQFGIATQTEYQVLQDRMRLRFGFGYASGDGDVASLSPTGSAGSAVDRQLTLDRTDTTFRFHPDYGVDLIFFRNILSRVQGAYYFRPAVEYDFFRDADQRVGGGSAFIWSRASEPVQAPGHEPDLGAELNLKFYYQLSPGRMSGDVDQMGGFYTALEYGVFFPLAGLDYLPGQSAAYRAVAPAAGELEISPAQIARLYLGMMF